MGLEDYEQERAEILAILADLNSGKVSLRDGQEELIAGLKRRLDYLEAKLQRRSGT